MGVDMAAPSGSGQSTEAPAASQPPVVAKIVLKELDHIRVFGRRMEASSMAKYERRLLQAGVTNPVD